MKKLDHFIHTFPGSSFPTKAVLSSGETCILKMRGSGNGISSLIAELVVNSLAAQAGLPVPEAFPVAIPAGLPWTFGTDEFDDIVQKSDGANLGIAWLDAAVPLRVDTYGQLPASLLISMLAIDLLFCNVDRLPKSHNILQDASGKLWLIDHGSCLFLRSPSLLLDLIPSARIPMQEIQQPVEQLIAHLCDLGKQKIQVPSDWLAMEGLTPMAIAQAIANRQKMLDQSGLFAK